MKKATKVHRCTRKLEELGARIQRIRKEKSLSIEEVAAKSLSAGNLSEIENGKRDPRLSTLCEIATRLNIRVTALLEGLC